MYDIDYTTIDWTDATVQEFDGESGKAVWKTIQFPGLRLRIVQYSPNYTADHWCAKGHIVHCLEGEFESELHTGEKHRMAKGMIYVVSDERSSHRSLSKDGATLLIIDGDFLKPTVQGFKTS